MTGGAASMPGVPRTTALWSTLAWAIVAILIAYFFQISRFGLRLRAAREDQGAAISIGVNVVWHRIFAFCLSAFVVGAGGGLYIHFLGIGSPETFYLGITFMTLAMLVVGGMNSLWGAVLGTLVVIVIGELLLRIELASGALNLREVGLALVMLAILILRPRGITRGQEFKWHRLVEWIMECSMTPSQIIGRFTKSGKR
jgi:branched-chain amino acid transport system permease protein